MKYSEIIGGDYIQSLQFNFYISINIVAHSTQVTMFLGQTVTVKI